MDDRRLVGEVVDPDDPWIYRVWQFPDGALGFEVSAMALSPEVGEPGACDGLAEEAAVRAVAFREAMMSDLGWLPDPDQGA